MPGRSEHLEQPRENRRFAQGLLATSAADPTALQWATTAAFYSAMHCLEAHLARFNTHSENHYERETYLVDPTYGIPRNIQSDYRQLKSWSNQVRYRLRRPEPGLVRTHILPCLERLAQFFQLDAP